ncbi:MAG TPA: BTAD domain-containing putative transcriptional regulator [Actinoplanes sp.]|nr:BTAD domain-containing putative transcriptional regulator [Actinoplanes sp.]
MPMCRVELTLLRGFALVSGGERVPLVLTAQRLVGYLAVQQRPVHRPHVAAELWPGATAERANANLRSALWRVQRSCPQLIDASAQQLSLAPDVGVDLRRARHVADRLLDDTRDCADILDAGTRAELAAEVLPDWHDDQWLTVEREQYHQLRLHALEAMCDRLLNLGRHGEAVAAGLVAVRADPLRESAHRAVIRAHLAAGNRWEAARQFDECRRVLRDDLGLAPSPDLQDLAALTRPRVGPSRAVNFKAQKHPRRTPTRRVPQTAPT